MKRWMSGVICALAMLGTARAEDVTTYHYDTLRTGWNPNETTLTPSVVKSGSGGKMFEMTSFTALDDQVDAQPLVVTGQAIKGKGTHDVVYVVTENNTLYALDANTGAILRQRNFGAPVPIDDLPGGCNNNSNNVGIMGTPVIDPASKTMYLIAYTLTNGAQRYTLYGVDISTLGNAIKPVMVKASGKLTNGRNYHFNAAVSRQRPGLLLANGNIYAGFGSFCDVAADQTRGWVLGWQKDTLAPLAANELTDTLATSTDTYFLTSVWMSGYGLASLPSSGDIYFITGNSDPNGDSINAVTNVAESAVQISGDLTTVESVFTPDNAVNLENGDGDFGSGGLLLLPGQGSGPDLAVGTGKDGNMYLLNADNLDNNTTGDARMLGDYNGGSCWCGSSYFTESDGTGRVISSGNNSVGIWRVKAGAHPALALAKQSANISGSQDPGFFTAVSSNGTTANSAVIWAVSRADDSDAHDVMLYAFDGAKGAMEFSGFAGTWPNTGGNANIVPVEANGKVYVVSYQGLAIFGLGSPVGAEVPANLKHVAAARPTLQAGVHEVYGIVHSLAGEQMTIARRDGSLLTVDGRNAARALAYAEPSVGKGVLVRGTYVGKVLTASVVLHAKTDSAMWPSDR